MQYFELYNSGAGTLGSKIDRLLGLDRGGIARDLPGNHLPVIASGEERIARTSSDAPHSILVAMIEIGAQCRLIGERRQLFH